MATLLAIPTTSCTIAADDAGGIDDDLPLDDEEMDPMLEERRRIAESGRQLFDPGSGGQAAPATADQMLEALDIAPEFVTGVSAVGPAPSMHVLDGWGVVQPLRGPSFTVLSTGVVDSDPEPGTDMAPGGFIGDVATLEIELNIPDGMNRLSFYYDFLSSEFPEFVGFGFNDSFSATLIESDGVTEHLLVTASVDTSEFHGASETNSQGTRYDIKAADTDGVDYTFNVTGDHDAGVTDFQRVDVALPATGNVTLVFEIHDEGDGILDSAVILDDLRLHAMETLSLNPIADNTQPDLVGADGSISDVTADLVAASRPVRGVAADGVTQVLLRTRVSGPGTVEYSVLNTNSPHDGLEGGVSELNGDPGNSAVIEAVLDAATGEYWAFATYTAPADFVRPDPAYVGDELLARRNIELRAEFTPQGAMMPLFEDVQNFMVARPPVVLIDGVWTLTDPWFNYFINETRFDFTRITERSVDINSDGVVDNYDSLVAIPDNIGFYPDDTVSYALEKYQDLSIAASQVDMIAHGSGGLLARQYMSQVEYENAQNFDQGSVHKFISINTPHLGSGFAPHLLRTLPSYPIWSQHQVPIAGGGSFNEMQNGSTFFDSISATDTPSHAITGNDGSGPQQLGYLNSFQINGLTGGVFWYVHIANNPPAPAMGAPPDWANDVQLMLDDMFGVDDHDLFATVPSQEGGLTGSAITLVESTQAPLDTRGLHYRSAGGATGSGTSPAARADYEALMVDLLNASVAGDDFASMPAPASLLPMAESPPVEPAPPVAQAYIPNGLTILSPADGTPVEPGVDLEVTVDVDVEATIEWLLVVSEFGNAYVENPVFPQSIMLPIDDFAAGPINVRAIGFDGNGDAYVSPGVDLNATPTAPLTSVQLFPRDPRLLGVGSSFSASVIGSYDDGVHRIITASTTGTVYSSSDPSIFTVTPEGVVTATGVGKATLIARNGDVQDSVTVDVRPGMTAGFEMITDWGQGYCASVRVTNSSIVPTTDWEVSIDMGDSTINETWNGVFSAAAGTVDVGPQHEWQFAIPGGATKGYTGYCATRGPSMQYLPTVVDVTASH